MAAKRPIFEEVGADAPRAAPTAGVIDAGRRTARGAIRIWLWLLFALVVVMIMVGGLTRLTDSGLSITEWAPIMGAVPPLSAAGWNAAFEAYKATPEYELQNSAMTLGEFKVIYWWEWGHRQLGRVIGLVWLVGFVAFWALGRIPPGWRGRLLILGALGALQGAVGWWMVASGLEGDRVDVASYRLATHLGLAFVILGAIAWFAFQLGRREAALIEARRHGDARLYALGAVLVGLTFLQIVLGALVAGIDAGLAYGTWPLMAGGLVPPEMWSLDPVWRNLFENQGTVQFFHRLAGYVLAGAVLAVWVVARGSGHRATRFAFNVALAVVAVQIAIGVLTVLYGAPWYLAILHQATAVALWVAILRGRFLARYPQIQSLRQTA